MPGAVHATPFCVLLESLAPPGRGGLATFLNITKQVFASVLEVAHPPDKGRNHFASSKEGKKLRFSAQRFLPFLLLNRSLVAFHSDFGSQIAVPWRYCSLCSIMLH